MRSVEIQCTHDLAALGQAIVDDGESLPLSVDELRCLNPFAVEFRYDEEIIPATTRDELSNILSTVLTWAERLVGV